MRKKITVLCPCNGQNNCPEIYSDNSMPAGKQIEITDDFDGKISMSKVQFNIFIKQAKDGKFDAIL